MYAMGKIPDENRKSCQKLLSWKYKKSAYELLAEYDLIFKIFHIRINLQLKVFLDNLTSAFSFWNIKRLVFKKINSDGRHNCCNGGNTTS